MKKLLLIVNPQAGQRKACRHLADIIDIFNRSGYTVITHITSCAGDGEQTIIRNAEETGLVVCCGGDGTFTEAISGVLKSGKNIPIGYIPCGSTNDYASTLNLSTDLVHAAYDIVSGRNIILDVGTFNGRYFSYAASFGMFTKTSYSTPQEMKNIMGRAAYVLNSAQELSQIKTYRVRVELDNGQVIEDDFIFGAISNSTRLGGVLNFSSGTVDMSDGLFEVFLARKPKDRNEVLECIQAMRRKTYQCAMVTFVKASRMTITAPETMDWTLDGEKADGERNITIECLNKAFHLRCRSI